MKEKIVSAFKKDPVLYISGVLAVMSCFLVPPSAAYVEYINFRVLALLFCLMGIVAGLKAAGVFIALSNALLSLTHTMHTLAFAFVCLCFFLSMFLTNDVALVTVVPFTLLVFGSLSPTPAPAEPGAAQSSSRSAPQSSSTAQLPLVLVLETIAANLGSMLTPIGNPQNLYLFSHYNMGFGPFLALTAPYTVLSFILLVALCFTIVKNEKICMAPQPRTSIDKSFWLYLVLFLLALLTVAHVLHWAVLLGIVCAVILVQNKKLFAGIDYALLVTFVFFFVFVGNMGKLPALRGFLESAVAGREALCSVLASQVISNVPAALLLSGFTENGAALVIGTNLGGLGTIIASMASLITYKFCDPAQKGRYLGIFTVLNFVLLAVLYAVSLVLK